MDTSWSSMAVGWDGKPMSPDVTHVTAGQARESHPEPGLIRRMGAVNERMTLVEHRMEKGWVGTAHSHPHDQVVFMISGHIRFAAGGETFDLGPGDSLLVRGGVEHQAWAIEPSYVIDVFTPCREDYL
jgi:quercetin dioxygenase-like cupin family protein